MKDRNSCPNCAIGILVYRLLYTHYKDDKRLDHFRLLQLNTLSVQELKDIYDNINNIINKGN
jgi:hypothetical protein